MLLLLLLLLLAPLTLAIVANFTVDDEHYHLLYLPNHAWLPATRPGYSWHQSDPSRLALLHFSFVGTAIFLYALPLSSPANISFALDDRPLLPCADTPADPNILALRNLPNTRHTLLLTVHPGSTFFFDYLVYTADLVPSPVLRMQPRQVTDSSQTLTPSPTPVNGSQQIGAIAGAIAASIGITSLFSIGLAVSIIKIRRQRLRNRREREAELERTRGLSLHLPSAPARTGPVPRYASGQGPPPYDSLMRLMSPAPVVLATLGHLSTIEEVATIRSSQASRLTPPEGSLSEAPDNPPGLTLTTVSDHPSEETIRSSSA
ncbi:hypothetical protein APHAL10511_007586 [Amanita phalloides]|nr:hypothetical protein APHAL10511_007586 [Amanita phalloides]